MEIFGVTSQEHSWREFYEAAILEFDYAQLPHRIAEAEQAIAQRAKQMFWEAGDQMKEKRSLDDATHALEALKGVLRGRAHYSSHVSLTAFAVSTLLLANAWSM